MDQIIKRDASKLESNFEFDDRKESSIPWILINMGMQLHSKKSPVERSKIEAEMVRSLEKILCELSEQEKSKIVTEALESLQWRVSRELSQIEEKGGLACNSSYKLACVNAYISLYNKITDLETLKKHALSHLNLTLDFIINIQRLSEDALKKSKIAQILISMVKSSQDIITMLATLGEKV